MYLVSKIKPYLSDMKRKLKPLNMTAVEYLAKQYDWLLSMELTQKFSKHLEFEGFYCQREIESQSKCTNQCDHCKEYYKPLEQ